MPEGAHHTTAAAEMRVLLLAPSAKDAALSQTILGDADLACVICEDLARMAKEMEAGAGAALLTEEALRESDAIALVDVLGRQPAWSDLPIVLLTRDGP